MNSAIGTCNRWLALCGLCFAVVTVVLDATVVNVALPSIRQGLKFTGTSLVWVVNAYTLTYGCSLLLGGRLGDIFGRRRIFLTGLALFTGASMACGLANSQGLLVGARVAQGFGGSAVVAVALSLIMTLFPGTTERAKAVGVYSFVCACGGSLGLILGGFVTSTFNWHWIFLVNLPVGVAVGIMLHYSLPYDTPAETNSRHLDLWSAVTGTLGLRNLAVANAVGGLWTAGASAWFFISSLYMQRVLGVGPMEAGLAFLPATLLNATFALGVSARMANSFGIKKSLTAGLLLVSVGLALLARAPTDGSVIRNVIPSMIILGLGAGITYNPLVLAAMRDVPSKDAGMAAGFFTTSNILGGALGLSVLVTLAEVRTAALQRSGVGTLAAITGGYDLAFLVAALFTALAGGLGALMLKLGPAKEPEPAGQAIG